MPDRPLAQPPPLLATMPRIIAATSAAMSKLITSPAWLPYAHSTPAPPLTAPGRTAHRISRKSVGG